MNYDKSEASESEATFAEDPKKSMMRRFQEHLRRHEQAITEACFLINTEPQKATLILATLIQDFRQMAGMANEIQVHMSMLEEHLYEIDRKLGQIRGVAFHVGTKEN